MRQLCWRLIGDGEKRLVERETRWSDLPYSCCCSGLLSERVLWGWFVCIVGVGWRAWILNLKCLGLLNFVARYLLQLNLNFIQIPAPQTNKYSPNCQFLPHSPPSAILNLTFITLIDPNSSVIALDDHSVKSTHCQPLSQGPQAHRRSPLMTSGCNYQLAHSTSSQKVSLAVKRSHLGCKMLWLQRCDFCTLICCLGAWSNLVPGGYWQAGFRDPLCTRH